MQNRNSAQRSLILDIMAGNKTHPTADEIYEEARKKDPHISRGTVYRNLNFLVDSKNILRIPVPNGADHFDSTLEEHYHFYCENCGKVTDVPELDISKIKEAESALSQQGYSQIKHKIVFEGLCPECSRKF
ncbi:MAG: transcriptional repressor [Treponema sp.]|nr:transcriptional repressor [Treponema sp.]